MANTISPSKPITDGQIGKASELLTSILRKNSKEFPSDTVQQVLKNQGGQLAKDLLAVFRKYMDSASNLMTRVVKVDRTRSPQDALKATGRNLYITDSVVASMPNGTDEEVEVIFFKLDREVSNDNLMKEYELLGLDPVDPHTLAAVNEENPEFADKHPHGTQWKDSNGKWCCAAFSCWGGDRYVRVRQDGRDWHGHWWFAGVRKSTQNFNA